MPRRSPVSGEFSRRTLLLAAVVAAAGCTETVRSPPGARSEQGGGAGVGGVGVLPSAPQAPNVPTRVRSVTMIGDSITKLSEKALESVFAAQGVANSEIDAQVSRRIKVGNGKGEPLNGERVLDNLLTIGADPDVWVVALGTNDASSYDAAGLGELIDEMLLKLPSGAPVVWVDVFLPQRIEITDRFNTVLRERISTRANTTIGSWFAVASADPKALMSGDRIHPSDAGQVAFAAMVGKAVAAAV